MCYKQTCRQTDRQTHKQDQVKSSSGTKNMFYVNITADMYKLLSKYL